MNWLLIVNNPQRWNAPLHGAEVVSARDYLTQPDWTARKGLRVINLCRAFSYQSTGYYVSLLAEARGHRPIPSVTTIQDFKSPRIIREVADELDDLIQRTLRPIQSPEFVLSVYFGRNLAVRHNTLARRIFGLFPAPLLRVRFVRDGSGRWSVDNVSPISTSDVPENHRDFLQEAAADLFARRQSVPSRRKPPRYEIAMLIDPEESDPPSNAGALRRFEQAGQRAGVRLSRITYDDFGDLLTYDGLFIRTTTAVDNRTYRFARMAEAAGMAVIDDTQSILRCSNKVFLQEVIARHAIPAPATAIVHRDNLDAVIESLGVPCVLKQPDSAFSKGVSRVETADQFRERVRVLLEDSELLIAQRFVPTEFDWRIGVLDGRPLFACRYFMARGHWQIYNHNSRDRSNREGDFETIPIAEAPATVRNIAAQAAGHFGSGLYGVDLKEAGGEIFLIEVNDNPNIDAGVEDAVLGDELYDAVIRALIARIESAWSPRRPAETSLPPAP